MMKRSPQALGLIVAAAGVAVAAAGFVRPIFAARPDKVASIKPEGVEIIPGAYADIPSELSDSEWTARLRVATQVALKAGKAMKIAMLQNKNVAFKGAIDLVTETDRSNERLIFETLRAHFPDDKFIGEEASGDAGQIDALTAEKTWVVDPIDGTTNFVHGFPACCVSVGFAVNRQLTLGVVYDPNQNETFQTIRGRGAFLNGARQRASGLADVSRGVVIQEWGYERTPKGIAAMLAVAEGLLHTGCRGLRQLGSGCLDLVYVGCGRADAAYCGVAGESWKPWDYAAGALFAEEAGAVMSTAHGEPFDIFAASMVCAATPALRDELVRQCAKGFAVSSAEENPNKTLNPYIVGAFANENPKKALNPYVL